MDSNVYRVPESEVSAAAAADAAQSQAGPVPFYVAAPGKFLLLFFSTLGLYHLYWFYKNWTLYARFSGVRLWPVARAIFSIFFTHSFFGLVDREARHVGVAPVWSASGIATLYVICTLASNLCDRLAWKEIGTPYTDFLSLILLIPIGWALHEAQKVVNLACGDPAGKTNRRISGLNYLWIFLGTFLWLLIFVDLYDLVFGLPV